MKKYLSVLSLALCMAPASALACEVCKKNQPKALQGITHGQGPESQWDLVIIIAAAIIVLLTLIYSLRYLIRPNEHDSDHIKNIVIEK